MAKTCGIYKITSPKNRIYIGQSVNIENRLCKYKKLACEDQTRLYRSLLKHGVENHSFEIIHICKKDELNFLECHYIEFFNTFNTKNGLNCRSGGSNPLVTDEFRKKMSELRKGNKNPFFGKVHYNETKKQMSLSRTGKKFSNETKIKMGLKSKGRCAFKGKKHSDATKLFMSEFHSGKPKSEETKNKMRLAKIGKPSNRWKNKKTI